MAITNDRRVYLGVHTTPEVKKKLEEEAKHRGMSVSLLTHRILVQAFALKEKKTQ